MFPEFAFHYDHIVLILAQIEDGVGGVVLLIDLVRLVSGVDYSNEVLSSYHGTSLPYLLLQQEVLF